MRVLGVDESIAIASWRRGVVVGYGGDRRYGLYEVNSAEGLL